MDDIGYFDDKGKWISENPSILQHYRQSHKNERTILKLSKWYPKRSLNENSYMWGVVYEHISQFTGMTPQEVHNACKAEFNFKFVDVVNKDTGEVKEIRVPMSTKDLSTSEMENYLEAIRRYYLSEFGLLIPLPNEIL